MDLSGGKAWLTMCLLAVSGDEVFFGCVHQEEGRPGIFVYKLDANYFAITAPRKGIR